MRDLEEIKKYWNSIHRINHLGALSGCEYQGTIDFLKVTDLLKRGDKVLEVGVGLGYVTKGFKDNGMDVSALDIAQEALDRVRDYCEGLYLVEELDKLPNDYFDIIICHNGIQHIPTHILENELLHIIRSLKITGIFAMEFISTDLIDDTGVDSEVMAKLRWDENIGCYCRTPEYLEKMINKCGGECKLVHDYHGNIAENITGCHIFHVKRR
jgi:cyclopropane fatty-acyl-phospholipid synthase-like methyltransferase